MSKSKRRKLKHVSDSTDLSSTSSSQHYRRSSTHVGETPQSQRNLPPQSPEKERISDHQDRSNNASLSNLEKIKNIFSDSPQQPYPISKNYSMAPPAFKPINDRTYDRASVQGNMGQHATKLDTPCLDQTLIAPPYDPWQSSNFRNKILAQNKRRDNHHQMFTASIPQYSCFEDEGSVSIKESIASNDGQPDDRSDEDAVEETGSDDNTTSSSTDEESGDGSEDIDTRHKRSSSPGASDSSDESIASKRPAKHRKPNSDELRTRAALIGADAIEAMRKKEKAEMEKAAKRGEYLEKSQTHLSISRSPHNPSSPSTQQPTLTQTNPTLRTTVIQALTQQPSISQPTSKPALSISESRTLQSLRALIPPPILANAKTTLLNSHTASSSSSSTTPESNSTPSDLELTLTATRSLLIQLSAHRLGLTPTPTPNPTPNTTTFNSNPAHHQHSQMQKELIRIIQDREFRIADLERELATYRARR